MRKKIDVTWYLQEIAERMAGKILMQSRAGARSFLSLSGLAVRPGDVATAVPEPRTLALALLALGVMVVVLRLYNLIARAYTVIF